jgi:hypothetical protein
MGTYFTTNATQADIIRELVEPLKASGHLVTSRKVVEQGEPVLWTVEKGERNSNPYQFIGCYVLRKSPGGWGYKPMDETMGPCFYGVPKSWLDKYPCIVPNGQKGYSDSWRQEVRDMS